jgi:hypothetical protein
VYINSGLCHQIKPFDLCYVCFLCDRSVFLFALNVKVFKCLTFPDGTEQEVIVDAIFFLFHFQRSQMDVCVMSRALHWVPIPMGFGWAWVRCYCSWVGMSGHEWAWVPYYCSWVGIIFMHPCIHLQIGVKLLGCREYINQEALWAEANDSERLFICPIQPRLDVGG